MRYAQFRAPCIAPVDSTAARPIWSVMIPVYNRTLFLEQLLDAILCQDRGPDQMQIEVVDDCSTESDLEPLTKKAGRGRVAFHRQAKNVGLMQNLNSCISRARGRWIHLIPDDDLVSPGFYQALEEGLNCAPAAGAAFCRHRIIDGDNRELLCMEAERFTSGILNNFIDSIAMSVRVQIPAIVVRRDVYEDLGGFRPEIGSAADWEMWQRIAAHYAVYYEPRVLASYRSHGQSHTAKLDRSGDGMASMRRAIEAAHGYLPADRADRLTETARQLHAMAAMGNAVNALARGDAECAINQTRQGLLLSQSPQVREILETRVLPEFARANVRVSF